VGGKNGRRDLWNRKISTLLKRFSQNSSDWNRSVGLLALRETGLEKDVGFATFGLSPRVGNVTVIPRVFHRVTRSTANR
jgi:hypothetical protein